MQRHAADLVAVADTQIAFMAERSKVHDQETRVTVYTFAHMGWRRGDPGELKIECLVYDKDVLRMPSIKGLYKPYGNTPLCDAVIRVTEDLKLTPQKYGDHSFLVYLLTDGQENLSTQENITALPGVVASLGENWTLAGFVPDAVAKYELGKFGFPKDNIKVWDPSESGSLAEVGVAMAASADAYMSARSRGVRSTTSLYSMNAPDADDLKKGLTPVTPGSYTFVDVTPERLAQVTAGRIDQFMQLITGKPYVPDGRVFYEMTKRERIQGNKKVAVAIPDHANREASVYTGANARKYLGLPEDGSDVRVSPGRWKGYKVFVGTGSPNRRLVPGTKVLVFR
jgi:hypothetical protein